MGRCGVVVFAGGPPRRPSGSLLLHEHQGHRRRAFLVLQVGAKAASPSALTVSDIWQGLGCGAGGPRFVRRGGSGLQQGPSKVATPTTDASKCTAFRDAMPMELTGCVACQAHRCRGQGEAEARAPPLHTPHEAPRGGTRRGHRQRSRAGRSDRRRSPGDAQPNYCQGGQDCSARRTTPRYCLSCSELL